MPETLEGLIKWIDGEAASPTQRLDLAVATAQSMEEVADQLVGHYVDECRRSGLAWSNIGARLGVSKQAAQQRFLPRVDRSMFDRFTDRARRVLVEAQEEARLLNHNYLGTEHLLLGLLAEREGIGARVLEALGISLESVRGEIKEIVGVGPAPTSGQPPFTPRAKKVLELTYKEALQLGHNYIGTEHILLGMIREGEGVAAQVLQNLGADYDQARLHVLRLLAAHTATQQQSRKTKARLKAKSPKTKSPKAKAVKQKAAKAKTTKRQVSRRTRRKS